MDWNFEKDKREATIYLIKNIQDEFNYHHLISMLARLNKRDFI